MIKNSVPKNENMNNEELQYINLVKTIIEEGTYDDRRNDRSKSIFGASMYFNIENNKIPILTTKQISWKTCLKELLWFISGKTDNSILQSQNVKIWNGNASKEFLNSQGLNNLKENDLGPIYGHQWRHFNAKYIDCKTDYTSEGIDQLQYIIDNLKDPVNRFSRRLVMSAWNPCQLREMALPPCHILVQFNVSDGNKLSCALYQRSADIGLGVPYNITSYCFLLHLISHHCGLEPHEFIYNLGNCHIYSQHIDCIKKQIDREPYDFPTIRIINKYENINDYSIKDFEIDNYLFHTKINMEFVR